MVRKKIVGKIKQRGYWYIKFRPHGELPISNLIRSFSWCKEVVEKNSVRLRGWYYPHFPRREGEDTGLIPGENYYEGWIDWGKHKERWRMYENGTFTHFLSLREDWADEVKFRNDELETIRPGSILSTTGTVYQLTEIFEFLLRLTKEGVYKNKVGVSIGLYNTEDRKLAVLDSGRAPLFANYITGAEKIRFSEFFTKDQILDNTTELSLKSIIYFFHRFGWENPPIDVIMSDQQNFLKGKI